MRVQSIATMIVTLRAIWRHKNRRKSFLSTKQRMRTTWMLFIKMFQWAVFHFPCLFQRRFFSLSDIALRMFGFFFCWAKKSVRTQRIRIGWYRKQLTYFSFCTEHIVIDHVLWTISFLFFFLQPKPIIWTQTNFSSKQWTTKATKSRIQFVCARLLLSDSVGG